jgi:hypothetical protein
MRETMSPSIRGTSRPSGRDRDSDGSDSDRDSQKEKQLQKARAIEKDMEREQKECETGVFCPLRTDCAPLEDLLLASRNSGYVRRNGQIFMFSSAWAGFVAIRQYPQFRLRFSDFAERQLRSKTLASFDHRWKLMEANALKLSHSRFHIASATGLSLLDDPSVASEANPLHVHIPPGVVLATAIARDPQISLSNQLSAAASLSATTEGLLRAASDSLPNYVQKSFIFRNLPDDATEREVRHVFRQSAGFTEIRRTRPGEFLLAFDSKAAAWLAAATRSNWIFDPEWLQDPEIVFVPARRPY